MSDQEGEEPRQVRMYGRASDHAQVYQSGADQYVTNIHIAEVRSQTVHAARERADVVVQVLTRAVGEWAARCEELEEKARRAKAEGRAEAYAEFAERLKDAELSVMRAQRTMRQAERERARAEALLAQEQQRMAHQRRAAERDAGREQDAPRLGDPLEPSRDRQETEQFSDLMERAEAELGAVREELRQLGEEVTAQDGGRGTPRVVEGEWTRRTGTDERPVSTRAVAPKDDGGVRADPAPASSEKYRHESGPPRRFLIALAWALCAIPPWIPVLAVTAVRAAYASDASLWSVVPFAFVLVLASVVGFFFTLAMASIVSMEWLDRDSESDAGYFAFLLCMVGSAALFLGAFFSPLSWPGPFGGWGRGIASWVGVG